MQYQAIKNPPVNEPCLVLGVTCDLQIKSNYALDADLQAYLEKWVAKGDVSGKKDSYLLIHSIVSGSVDRVLLVGLGDGKLDGKSIAKTIRVALNSTQIEAISIAINKDTDDIESCIKTLEYHDYIYTRTKSKSPDVCPLKSVNFVIDTPNVDKLISQAVICAQGVNFARELANTPANLCTPSDLVEHAQTLVDDSISVEVLSEEDMQTIGMSSLLSVSAGSNQPAKLITLEYKGAGNENPYVLVGKGVTFDTGGISLKPGSAMDEMKFDMCGAASVLGVFKALSLLNLPINVVGIIPATENMPSGKATKPGDVVTSMSGQTIEILNTDAEGRLILCDALTYAQKFNPKQVIDIATLTGAVIIALGHNISGLMSNDNALADELIKASQDADDKVWRLPLADVDEDYDKQLNSNFADIANIGDRSAGTITAGCFLARFTKDYAWAHLDIAGVAWKTGKQKGATGRPVQLLLRYLLNKVPS